MNRNTDKPLPGATVAFAGGFLMLSLHVCLALALAVPLNIPQANQSQRTVQTCTAVSTADTTAPHARQGVIWLTLDLASYANSLD
jgi:hypothetical protein